MTVSRLRAEMPNEEFVRWSIYYQRIAQRSQMESQRSKRR